MTKMLTVLLVLGFTNQAMAISLECRSETPYAVGGRLIIKLGGFTDTLTVEWNGKAIYQDIPVVESVLRDRNTYTSPGFKNKNNAPANLFAQIYRKDGKVRFEFSESSYVPVAPGLGGECRQF